MAGDGSLLPCSVIGLMHYLGRKADQPRVKSVIQAVVAASAGLILATALPLAHDAILGTVTLAIAGGVSSC